MTEPNYGISPMIGWTDDRRDAGAMTGGLTRGRCLKIEA